MKVVASYFGEVTGIYKRGVRIVTLTRKNGEQLVADLSRSKGKHYKMGDCFRFKVIKNGKTFTTSFKKINPRTPTPKQIARIRREVERKLAGISLDKI